MSSLTERKPPYSSCSDLGILTTVPSPENRRGGSANLSKVPRDDLAQDTTVCHPQVLKLL